MENRFYTTVKKIWVFLKEWTLVAIILALGMFLVYWTVKGIFSNIFLNRLEAYMRISLVIMGVGVFGVLRMYNSVVANTRFLIKIREAVRKITQELPTLSRSLKQTGSSTDRNNTYIKNLGKNIESLSKEVEDLDLTIERLNSIGKKDER